jgi:uncharacterized protein (TIGR02680 family)
MTINLFPGPEATTAQSAAADDRHDGHVPIGRWVLHRAGILNVWQYDHVELRFAGGRLLLRGKNGAGKSKALEVLLPFLFDGDTRQLDATGRDRTTVTWLMTDGRPNGHHVGYVWLELRCRRADGTDAFQTLGAGLKASTATRRADCWFFLTDRRVGVDLDLDVAGECLSVERLKQAIGADAVTTSGVEHRRRVGRHVFGLFDEARYRNLLHLLHRLRDPNIGNRVEAGELASVLTDALPPIDERVLAEAAGHFDDLDVIREQVDRSASTAQALGQFLGAYRGYTRTVLSRRATAVEQAEAGRARAARSTRQLVRAVDESAGAIERADAELTARKRERADCDAERREIERSEGYRAHQDLVDRQERVTALDSAARAAESSADRAATAHHRAVTERDDAVTDVRGSLAAVAGGMSTVARLAVDAGLEPAVLGERPAAAPDGDVDPDDVARAVDRAQVARKLVDGRRQRADRVRGLAREAEQAQSEAEAAERRAAESEAEVDQSRAEVAGARTLLATAENAWADAVTAWTTTRHTTALDVDWQPLLDVLGRREGEPTWVAAARRSAAECLAPAFRSARTAAAAAELAVAAAQDALATAEARLTELEAQPEVRPIPGRYRDGERNPAAGVPFYELVDIAPGVAPADAAGVEAALEAAGLLDAWVGADGLVVHPDTRDTLLDTRASARPLVTATLADVLVPTPAAGGPVSVATIEAVLRLVGLGEQRDAAAWVTAGGRWSLGVLRGAWHKPAVEFLGASARRETRARLLAELRAALATCRDELGATRARAEAASRHRDVVESLPGSLPADDALDEAGREMRSAERSLAAARARHDGDRRRAEQARSTANRRAAVVADETARDALPTAVDALDAVLAALADLRDALSDHQRSLRDLNRAVDWLRDRRSVESDRRAEADVTADEARRRRTDQDVAAHALATLRQALAATVDTVLSRHSEVTARLVALDETLVPAAERGRREADTTHATAAARLDEARTAERQAEAAVDEAGRALAAAVVLPGVMLAAAGRDVHDVADLVTPSTDAGQPDLLEPAGGPAALAAVVAPLVDGHDEVTDGTILSRYDRLSDALAGGYDSAIDEHDGVKVVHVADDNGRQPLAVVAARQADEAEAARGRLAAREREVLERFLLRELADEVRSKLLDSHDLVAATNRTLTRVRTSHGKGGRLDWTLRDDASGPSGVAARLLVDELRDEAGDRQLRDALLALIEAERAADPGAGYEQHLRAALDYRAWHRFTVKVTDAAQPGSSRSLSNRLGLSQGEQRVLSYLALFAAAAAHFEAIARETPTAPRLLLLDDAFAKVDEPTHGHLLGLLVDLGLDFVLTSERMWGCFPTVPGLEIYEAVRDPAHPGVALVHFRWDGRQRHLVGV